MQISLCLTWKCFLTSIEWNNPQGMSRKESPIILVYLIATWCISARPCVITTH